HVGNRRDSHGDVLTVVELEEEIAGDAEREEVHRRPADDLIGAQVDREKRVHEGEQPGRGHGRAEPDDPAVSLVGAVDAPRGAHTMVRASIGGSVRTHAKTPSRTPTTPIAFVDMIRSSASECSCSTRTVIPWLLSYGACGACSRRRG